MPNYTFTTPVVEEGPSGLHRLFYFYTRNVAVSVYKDGGVYRTIRYVQDSFPSTVDAFYGGGYKHTVDEATKTELLAAGIGITEANFTAQ